MAINTSSSGDHAEVAVRGLGRVDEQRRRAGRGQRGRDLAGDMAGLADAGDDDAPLAGKQELHRSYKGIGGAVGDAVFQRQQGIRFNLKRGACEFKGAWSTFSACAGIEIGEIRGVVSQTHAESINELIKQKICQK